ncbi:hypothetical protein H9P43_000339 [Blastocladiella emersonii ATCC 22665]|nr:hypothetical protein H9P43_000339 [Blastocladiella emersonii ATCC 22665]
MRRDNDRNIFSGKAVHALATPAAAAAHGPAAAANPAGYDRRALAATAVRPLLATFLALAHTVRGASQAQLLHLACDGVVDRAVEILRLYMPGAPSPAAGAAAATSALAAALAALGMADPASATATGDSAALEPTLWLAALQTLATMVVRGDSRVRGECARRGAVGISVAVLRGYLRTIERALHASAKRKRVDSTSSVASDTASMTPSLGARSLAAGDTTDDDRDDEDERERAEAPLAKVSRTATAGDVAAAIGVNRNGNGVNNANSVAATVPAPHSVKATHLAAASLRAPGSAGAAAAAAAGEHHHNHHHHSLYEALAGAAAGTAAPGSIEVTARVPGSATHSAGAGMHTASVMDVTAVGAASAAAAVPAGNALVTGDLSLRIPRPLGLPAPMLLDLPAHGPISGAAAGAVAPVVATPAPAQPQQVQQQQSQQRLPALGAAIRPQDAALALQIIYALGEHPTVRTYLRQPADAAGACAYALVEPLTRAPPSPIRELAIAIMGQAAATVAPAAEKRSWQTNAQPRTWCPTTTTTTTTTAEPARTWDAAASACPMSAAQVHPEHGHHHHHVHHHTITPANAAAASATERFVCANMGCHRTEPSANAFHRCSRCRIARYCSNECQAESWQRGHRSWCRSSATPAAATAAPRGGPATAFSASASPSSVSRRSPHPTPALSFTRGGSAAPLASSSLPVAPAMAAAATAAGAPAAVGYVTRRPVVSVSAPVVAPRMVGSTHAVPSAAAAAVAAAVPSVAVSSYYSYPAAAAASAMYISAGGMPMAMSMSMAAMAYTTSSVNVVAAAAQAVPATTTY